MIEIEPFSNVYPSKIILFGEYTVLTGGTALAIPLNTYFSQWKVGKSEVSDALFNHFMKVSSNYPDIEFSTNAWNKIKSKNLFLYSTIPHGYGLGSSGNYIAALADTCCSFDKKLTPVEIKKILGELENYFHGNSSGLDPLVIFLKKTTLISGGNVKLNNSNLNLSNFYLYDSGIKRQAQPLIQLFNEKIKNQIFKSAIEKLKVYNEDSIDLILNNQNIESKIREISQLQFEYMSEWIPNFIKALWQEGLEKDLYYFKFCGAGGGGFFLVYTKNEPSNDFQMLDLIPISSV
ncbi:MAG: hypothetical protein RLZZ546_1537 [Bacteroidota bacterium]|jgi:mevalonate kinase